MINSKWVKSGIKFAYLILKFHILGGAMMKIFPFFTIYLFVAIFTSNTFAAPLITSTSGNFADGANFEISGSGFGGHTIKIEWLGGQNGNIEQGADGSLFSKKNWSAASTSVSFQSPVYSSTKSHSGTKSIKSYYPLTSQYGSGIAYNAGEIISKIYVTWWVYFDWGGACDGQWKLWRLRSGSDVNDSDGEIYQNSWFNTDGTKSQEMILYFCDADAYAQCYPGSDARLRWMSNGVSKGAWQRLELYAVASSDAGVRDGSVVYNIHKQDSPVTSVKNDIGTVITRASGVTNQWQWFHFQNYWGNKTSGDDTVTKIYMDDIYIQTGTQARVEIGDNPIWANCKHREIQYPTAWSDTNISITVNRGSFSDGQTVYLFILDDKGYINSQGFPITIKLGDPPPSAPKAVRILN